MQTENAQVELSNEIIEGLLKTVREKLNDFTNKLKDRMRNLEHEFQVAKFDDVNRLHEKLENIKKLIQEKKINIKEGLAKMIEEKQKIETDYQLSLSISMKLLKPLIMKIGFEVFAPIVKDKIQEMWNKRQSETYGIMGNIGGIIKDMGNKVDKKVGEIIKESIEIIDKLEKIEKDLIEDGKKKIDKVTDGVIKKIEDMKNTITGEKYQQPQQAIFDNIGGFLKKTGGRASNIVESGVGIGIDAVEMVGGILNDILKPWNRKGEKKPEDGKKTDKSEEKENNIEVPEKEKENNIEVPEKED